MSLGTWFRDYVYIPLGGNRGSKFRHLINIFVVWLLTGFWHGASWNFIIWGLFFGVLLTIEKFFLLKYLNKSRVLNRVYVLLAVVVSFIVFNIETLPEAFKYIGGLFGAGGISFSSPETLYHLRNYAVLLIFAIVGSTPIVKKLATKFSESKVLGKVSNVIEPIMLVVLLAVITAFLVDSSSNPFLYFRF
jgi:alginate O-acetyltransferase complex protein AlgI